VVFALELERTMSESVCDYCGYNGGGSHLSLWGVAVKCLQ